MTFRILLSGLIILGFAEEVWSHVEIEAEDYFFPLEPKIGHRYCASEALTCLSRFLRQEGNLRASTVKTNQEGFNVINFCKMADQCQHDFVPICGQDSLGITRMFNDNCDLYEYNCDEKKQYRHVKMDVCNYEAAAAERIM